MLRLAAFSFFLCFLILVRPATQALAQDAKPDDPPPLKVAGLRFPHPGCESALFSPDGRLLVTKSSGSIIVWDATTGKTIGEPIPVRSGRIIPPLEFTHDGKFLIQFPRPTNPSGNEPFELRWWESPGIKLVGEPLFKGASGDQCHAAIGPAGLFLTANFNQKAYKTEICLRELAKGKVVGKPWTVDGWVNAVAFSSDGKQVFIGILPDPRNGYRPWGVQRYDVSNGTPVGRSWRLPGGKLISIVVSSDGKSAATISIDLLQFRIQRFNVETDQALAPKSVVAPTGKPAPWEPMQMVAIHKDARTVAVATKDLLTVQVLDLDTGKAISPDLKHSEAVFRLILSPDGKRVLTASGTDRNTGWLLWDVTTGQRIARVPQKGAVRVIAFRPDGKALVTGSPFTPDDAPVTLWELPAQK